MVRAEQGEAASERLTMNSRERRHAKRRRSRCFSRVRASRLTSGLRLPDGGHWEGRYFVWDWKFQSMSKELSAADMNRMLTRRPTRRMESLHA